mmetsp:Transcript_63239/g.105292  ORF Transcript_63239/g.105292 Transcript_63239/m.105292 type:complete len:237 (-) Transcript_63239:594-1304(-)
MVRALRFCGLPVNSASFAPRPSSAVSAPAAIDCIAATSARAVSGLRPWACVRATSASAVRPRSTSHRADSGAVRDSAAMGSSKSTAAPNTERQSPEALSTAPDKYPRTMPATMAASFRDTSCPRCSDGTDSAMYRGATCIAVPIPRPYTTRPASTSGSEGARVWIAVPAKYKAAAACSSVLRPIWRSPSAIRRADATTAPTRDPLASQPSCRGSNGPRSVAPEPKTRRTELAPPIS